jgi:uncharacterized protein (TIGR02231 family)
MTEPSIAAPVPSPSPLLTHHPAVDETRQRVTLPITKVTLLEDRAQVERRGRVSLAAGTHRLALWDVSPVLQDVSLRVEAKGAGTQVNDARLRRAMRVHHAEKPEAAAALEQRLTELETEHAAVVDDIARVTQRARVIGAMMQKATSELPVDAAWSLGDPASWTTTFESLSTKRHQLLAEGQKARRKKIEVTEAARFVQRERMRLDRPDSHLFALVEIDATAAQTGEVEFIVEYTVPNALWRPTHEAMLRDGKLTVTCRAALWQNTGEDWVDVDLRFSTARSSLGHEPPRLADDRLLVQKKDQRVVVAARSVAVQKAGLGRTKAGPGAASGHDPEVGIDLPGVDDGGDIQTLKSIRRVTVLSDGRPTLVVVGSSVSDAETSHVVMAELDNAAFVKATANHVGAQPLLAGPVELVRDSGFVGTTTTLFVAPGERFALGFGIDDEVRVQRRAEAKEVIDPIDQWRRQTHMVTLFLSNLGTTDKRVEIVERIPVSEIEHVRIKLLADKTSGVPDVDDDGFVRWQQVVPARGRLRLTLVYVVEVAPGVAGL